MHEKILAVEKFSAAFLLTCENIFDRLQFNTSGNFSSRFKGVLKVKNFYPLRPIQRMLIDTHLKKAKSTMMNIGALMKLPSGVDMERLARAVNETLQAHDIFKCRLEFHPETDELCQTFDSEPVHIEVKKISDEEFEERVNKFKMPYKFIGNPLYRIYLFQTPTAKYFYTDFYHATMDGTASAILFAREVDLRYRGRNLKNIPKSYLQYVLEEVDLAADDLDESRSYWKKILSKFDAKKNLPPVDVSGKKSWAKGTLKFTLKNIGEEFFRKSRRSEQTFFLAASMLTLAKISGAKYSVVNFIHNGRNNPSELRLMGLMLEKYPCAWNFDKDISVEDFLNELEGEIRKTKKFRKGLDVVYDEGLADDCATFIFQKDFIRDHVMIGDHTAQIIDMPPNEISAAENSLDIAVWSTERGTYDLVLDFDASRFSEDNMKNFATVMDKIILTMQDGKILISQILN